MSVIQSNDYLSQITPIILTYNEAPNIRRSLEQLRIFNEILVVDSGSSDATLKIVSDFPNTRVVTRLFDSHSNQWNFGLFDCGITSDWILALDADYVLTDDFVEEVQALSPEQSVTGYQVSFNYCVFGKPLSKTLYPPVVALFLREGARYRQDGHTQRLIPAGEVHELSTRILHDDRKPLSRWLVSQDNYAKLEADLLLNSSWTELKFQDRLRRLLFVTPWLVPLYCLTYGRGVLDGWAGIYYAIQRGVAEAILALRLIELRIDKRRE